MRDVIGEEDIHKLDKAVPNGQEDVELKEIFGALWAAKLPILMVTVLSAIFAIWYALSIPNQYKAQVVLAPAQEQSGGLSGALGQLGGLASLAGVSVGGAGANESQIAQEIMQSWSFIDQFIKDNRLEAAIFAVENWNKLTNQPQYNARLYDLDNRRWLIEGKDGGSTRPPSSWELFSLFSGKLTVIENKKTDFVTISIEYYSPYIAKKWLDMYVSAINLHMQQRQMTKVTNNIAYLEKQIEKTSIAEMKEVFFTIIQEQIKNKMLAEASPEYAFVAVNPSMLPEKKSQPKRALICMLIVFFATAIAIFTALLRHFVR